MSLFLSKLLPIFVYPLGLVIVLGLFAFLRGKRIGRAVLALALVLLWAASMPVSSNWLTAQLEAEYPPAPIGTPPHADVAIVLGGSIGQPLPPRVTSDLSDAADRVRYAARLFRAAKVDRILVSGGNLPWQAGVKPESQLVSDLLIEFGLRPDAIVQDAESRNTRENAVNSAVIMHTQAWRTALLVTSEAAQFDPIGVGADLDRTPDGAGRRDRYALAQTPEFIPDDSKLRFRSLNHM